MKTRLLSLVMLAAGSALVADAAITSSTPTVPNQPLQVSVQLPPDASLFWADRVAESLADCIESAFAQGGFHGPIAYLGWGEKPAPEAPRVEINLIEWRSTVTRSVDCTFSARLVTPAGSRDLGIFSGVALNMAGRRDPFGRADTFAEAAHDAGRDLYRALQHAGLLPTGRLM